MLEDDLGRGTSASTKKFSMVILTPSYAPDFDLCHDLNHSINRYSREDIEHHIVVSNRDLKVFSTLEGNRTSVLTVESQLPSHFMKIPRINGWLNLVRPFPPLRGWIVQQLVKLAYSASLKVDVVLLTDSDLLFIDNFSVDTFAKNGHPPLFRVPDGVDETLPRHRTWHEVAHRLLGIDPPEANALPDYIAWPCAWKPQIVREMLDLVSMTTGKHWATAIGSELHFSEMILYGVYVEHIVGRRKRIETTSTTRCLNYSQENPLGSKEIARFLQSASSDHVAVMVSAKSGTPLEVRREALADHQRKHDR